MKLKKIIFLPFLCYAINTAVYAETLPNGSVRGLPQNLIVCDSDGNSVSASGDYYIHIEDMQPGVLYTKDISVMNLRNDAVYRVYMSAAPNHTEGTIDLENEVDVKLYLDGDLIYTGNVNGEGTPDMKNNVLDLGGIYNSGQTRTLHAEFIWNMTQATEDHIQSISDAGGTAFGAVDFDWIFSASIRDSGGSSDDNNGGGSNSSGTNSGGGKSSVLNPPTDIDTGKNTENQTNNGGNPNNNNDGSDSNNNGDSNNENDGMGTDSDDRDSNNGGQPDDNDEGSDSADSGITDKGNIIDQIADNLPFIPEDVKTGYHSRIVIYIKILLASSFAAILLICGIIYKAIKLKRKTR